MNGEGFAKEDGQQWDDTARHEEALWVGLQEGTLRPADYRASHYLFVERYDREE